jgi:hypothetical protein
MKWVLRIALALVLIVIIAVVVAFARIDQLAKAGVETGATYALGVDTTLNKMDVGVLSGSVEMDALNVSNPSGFTSPHFFRLNDGKVAVSLGTLMEEKVVLPELKLHGVSMNLERKGNRSNYQVILDNLKRFESSEKAPPKESKEGKKFVIDKVSIKDVDVQVDLLPVGGELTRVPVKIEEIELQNVGSDSADGVMLADLTGILVEAILKAVVEKSGDLLPADMARELRSGLSQLEGLGATSMQVVGDVTTMVDGQVKQVGELGQHAAKQLQKSGKELTKQTDEVSKTLEGTLGGLLDKKKKKED